MAFKIDIAAQPLPALAGFGVLCLRGRDAEAFAQAQFMNDLRPLQIGQWQWNGWLNPKGRVIALFALLRRAEGELWLVLPDFPAGELAERLQRFVFRSKVELLTNTGRTAAALWPEARLDEIAPDRINEADPEAWLLDWGTVERPRLLCLLPMEHPALGPTDSANDARWRAFDIAHGLPRLGRDQVEAWTPQMLSLERLNGFSVKKGCYPGQEIVARTHFLGQAKRQLVRLAGTGLEPGQAVSGDDHPLGELVCGEDSGREALAVMAAFAAGTALRVGENAVHALPLREGLARSI